MPQAPENSTTLRRIQVSAQTIRALTRTSKYVVDLTQRGVKYEFETSAGQIDFSRVLVRTGQGEVAISAFLEKIAPKDKLATFKYASRSFSLGTRPPGTPHVLPPTTSRLVVCGSQYCVCSGSSDCFEMVFGGTFGRKLTRATPSSSAASAASTARPSTPKLASARMRRLRPSTSPALSELPRSVPAVQVRLCAATARMR